MLLIDTKLDPKDDGKDCTIEIFAELSRKQYDLIQDGGATIEVPHGVSMRNKTGSRELFFTCQNKLVAKELEGGLDNSNISWQENYIED